MPRESELHVPGVRDPGYPTYMSQGIRDPEWSRGSELHVPGVRDPESPSYMSRESEQRKDKNLQKLKQKNFVLQS